MCVQLLSTTPRAVLIPPSLLISSSLALRSTILPLELVDRATGSQVWVIMKTGPSIPPRPCSASSS